MGKYFGTDGARGRVNENLTLDMAIRIGQYLGWYYGKERHAKIIIGKDTRLSSDMFEMGLAAGATSTGATVYLLGVCPTPSVSYLIRKEHFDCGIMVSASHNPYHDNGIKLFNHEGCKMNPEVENAIEDYIDGKCTVPLAKDDAIGSVIEWDEGLEIYESWLKEIVNIDLSGMKIAVDLANGSATATAVETLSSLGATVEAIHNSPNGININTNCGSTHPQELQEMMREGNYDVGFAFDGDADRLIAVDEDGNLFNGDYTLYVCGRYMKKNNTLNKNTVVTTVMANLGLYHALRDNVIDYEQTAVGDKYVFECMQNNDYRIGGEQSGHVLLTDLSTAGDGMQTAIALCNVLLEAQQPMSKLKQQIRIYPQVLAGAHVKPENKQAYLEDEAISAMIDELQALYEGKGRVLVRPSGTEHLIRVMIEGPDQQQMEQQAQALAQLMEERLG